MAPEHAVAAVFMTAFKNLSVKEQQAILAQMLKIRRLRNDLIDIAIAEKRSRESSRSFRDFLKETQN